MLNLSHISKTFNLGTINEKSALQDLSLNLSKGEFATIIGSNGAGKSTLFNVISGNFYVDSGSIEIAGRAQACQTHWPTLPGPFGRYRPQYDH